MYMLVQKLELFPSGVDYINNAVLYNLNYMMFQLLIGTVQPARNLHKPSDPGGQNYPRAVEHRGRTPVDPGGHDPRVSR